MEDKKFEIIGSYEQKIHHAVRLIQSASEHFKSCDKVGQLYAAHLDVMERIGQLMSEISATEMRKGVK